MKKQKIFLVVSIFLAVVFLGGCLGQDKSKEKDEIKRPGITQENISKESDLEAEAKTVLPEEVSAEPGVTVDQEIKNIDNDLNAIDDVSLGAGMSDQELGL